MTVDERVILSAKRTCCKNRSHAVNTRESLSGKRPTLRTVRGLVRHALQKALAPTKAGFCQDLGPVMHNLHQSIDARGQREGASEKARQRGQGSRLRAVGSRPITFCELKISPVRSLAFNGPLNERSGHATAASAFVPEEI